MYALRIREDAITDDQYLIRLTLNREGQAAWEAEAKIRFQLSERELAEIRWYLEDYLQVVDVVEDITVHQIETIMKTRGEELYRKVLADNPCTQALWYSIRNNLADLRVEVATGIVEATSIPWELMRDPEMDSPISLRVKSFVRVQSNPSIGFVPIAPPEDGRIRLLYIACRPNGAYDVELRAVANRLLQGLDEDRARFEIKALRPPTFEQLQQELADARNAGRPYHIVHFDGHGVYADLTDTVLSSWLGSLSGLMLGAKASGKHGYLIFEHPGKDGLRPVDGQMLGQLLRDNDVPMLVLNACQSAMHEAVATPEESESVHDEVRAIGSFAQAVIDQGIPAVLGMRYSVYVVTAAQYIGQLYRALAKGRSFGQAAAEGRKHLHLNPDRWISLQPRSLQDWIVPVAYEATPIELLPGEPTPMVDQPELDPVQRDSTLLRYVPEDGFVGRDEVLLALDRAFDNHHVVLLHAYAGQGKSSTSVEFSRWYSITGGLGEHPIVLLSSFEGHLTLNDLLSQIGRYLSPILAAQGINWSAVGDTDERQKLVIKLLRRVPVLWIWDDVETVDGFPEGAESEWTKAEQRDLRDFLHQLKEDRASKIKILLISRREEDRWLGKIPHRIAMPRMRRPDSAKLAMKLGEEYGIDPSDIIDWQPLLDYCTGNPLTLRVLVHQAIKAGFRGRKRIENFVDDIRSGEQDIEDADECEGRDKSLGASLDYGFRHAFTEGELPIIALLHLFEGMVNVGVLQVMGTEIVDKPLPELAGWTREHLVGLLERATDSGLLTRMVEGWYTIHPALPWFLRRLFSQYYDGRDCRSDSKAALFAWAEAVGNVSVYCCSMFIEGNPKVADFLEQEEANLLCARRIALQNALDECLRSCMQGLHNIYYLRRRMMEWARLVDEVTPEYCALDNGPVPGKESGYKAIMDYRVELALQHEHDPGKALELQRLRMEHNRQQASTVLSLPEDTLLDDEQRGQLMELAQGFCLLGQITMDAGSIDCVHHLQECIRLFRHVENNYDEANAEYELARAYVELLPIRDLDAAEAACLRSLGLRSAGDAVGRALAYQLIGTISYYRLLDARRKIWSPEDVMICVQAAEENLLHALSLTPKNMLINTGPIHISLGSLYSCIGSFMDALDHFESALQYFDKEGDVLRAGTVRCNIGVTWLRQASEDGMHPSEQRDILLRAQTYAEAALRDFERFGGLCTNEKANAKALLDDVNHKLAELP